ncbi:Uncharacterized protein SCF082_LOCUS13426, partial [Durusdinium trenchii]
MSLSFVLWGLYLVRLPFVFGLREPKPKPPEPPAETKPEAWSSCRNQQEAPKPDSEPAKSPKEGDARERELTKGGEFRPEDALPPWTPWCISRTPSERLRAKASSGRTVERSAKRREPRAAVRPGPKWLTAEVQVVEFSRLVGAGGGVPSDTGASLGLGLQKRMVMEPLATERPGVGKLDKAAEPVPPQRRAQMLREAMGHVEYCKAQRVHRKELLTLQNHRDENNQTDE